MITSNTTKAFGGKVATIETPSFSCFVSTAKEGFFKKQSLVVFDTTNGFSNRQVAAKFVFNDLMNSNERLGLHDVIIHNIDASGMKDISLIETLSVLFQRLHNEGIGMPEFDATWWNSSQASETRTSAEKKSDISLTSAAANNVLLTMKYFTSAALLMIPAGDNEPDIRTKRVAVFLFGAFDAVIQKHHITGQEKFDTLETYLIETFPVLSPSDIQETVSFLCEASSDPDWIPIMERGGQTLVDWARGDKMAPSRLFKVVKYGMDDS